MSSKDFNIQDSLQFPQTDFPMRGQLPLREPQFIELWNKVQVYEKWQDRNKKNEKFCMPDGPPYANGHIHLGHTLNKVLKDIVIKYKNMKGFLSPFVPGWDCHGLPIELKVAKLFKNKSDSEIRTLCREEAHKWIAVQKKEFQRLGVIAEWDKPYLTLDPCYEADEIRMFAKIYENGLLYRALKPVHWCTKLGTALAASEVEYKDHTSPSIYVKFYFDENPEEKPLACVIWTTTPWTLPANYGVSLNENIEYGVFESQGELLIIAKKLVESFEQDTGVKLSFQKDILAKDLERKWLKHPFMKNRKSLILLGDHVTTESGTGCVHTAPAHGLEDYHVGVKYDLPLECPVSPYGKLTDKAEKYEGLKLNEANEKIVADLIESKHLISVKKIKHSYPYNPRSNSPIIFRLTYQWFIRRTDENWHLKNMGLEACEKKIQFYPTWGQARLEGMIKTAPDWCVSRQRLWGVPLPIFYCNSCEEPLLNSDAMEKVATAIEKDSQGLEAFYKQPITDFIDNLSCEKCEGKEFSKSSDILDVWFDSATCHKAVQQKHPDMSYPADLYLEGSDQHRGWFQTSLFASLATNKEVPFKKLLTHGFVNDDKGNKMSKSLGNVIPPEKVIGESGAEILRIWVAHENYFQDIAVGKQIFNRIGDFYRRARNSMRFMLGNINDFSMKEHGISIHELPFLDLWALHRLDEVISECDAYYEKFEFYKVYHTLGNFFSVDLSSFYFDILKDRLYTSKKDGFARRASQTVLYTMTHKIATLMAPIMSFLAEESYQHLTNTEFESVFLEPFPEKESLPDFPMEQFEKLKWLRQEANKKIEELRVAKVIKSSLETHIEIAAPKTFINFLSDLDSNRPQDFLTQSPLAEFFISCSLQWQEGDDFSIQVAVVDETEKKCPRCWNYSKELISFKGTHICSKCIEALDEFKN